MARDKDDLLSKFRLREFALMALITTNAVLANLPREYVEHTLNINYNYLLAALACTVVIGLFLYLKFFYLMAVVLLIVGANVPDQIAEHFGISKAPLILALVLMVGISLINYVVKILPTGLEPKPKEKSLEGIRALFYGIDKNNLGYTIHLSQSTAEVDFMVRHHRLRPPAFLDRHGFLGPRLFAAHCRYVDAADIALLGRTRTMVTHQAAMAANRGVIPPIPALRAAGCPIALGTDNNTNDLFEVMRVALLTERIKRDDANPGTQPQPEDTLADATQGGARAVRQGAQLGSLETGKKADLLVLDTRRAHLVPAMRIVSAWIHNGQPSDIESVLIDGRFVMRNRKILTVDEDAIVAEADRVGRRVWGQVLAAGAVRVPRLPRN